MREERKKKQRVVSKIDREKKTERNDRGKKTGKLQRESDRERD